MSKNSQNVRIGECEVFLNEVDLGHTNGGVEFTFEREFTDLTVDQYGTSPVDMALTGNNLLVMVYLAEPTNKNIGNAIPEGAYAENADSTNTKIGLGTESGYLLSADAGLLRLHPRRNSGTNRNEDIYIWKAVSSETVELPYKIDEQRVLKITFRALVDETQPAGTKLGRVGDPDIS